MAFGNTACLDVFEVTLSSSTAPGSMHLHASRKHVASLNSCFHLSLLVTNSSKMFSMMETHGDQCSEVSFPPKAPKPPQSWTIENGLSFPELICTRPLCEHRVEIHSDQNKHLLCDFYYHITYE